MKKTKREDILMGEFDRFKNMVRDIINEQKSYTLRLAYGKLCDCSDSNLKSILEFDHD